MFSILLDQSNLVRLEGLHIKQVTRWFNRVPWPKVPGSSLLRGLKDASWSRPKLTWIWLAHRAVQADLLKNRNVKMFQYKSLDITAFIHFSVREKRTYPWVEAKDESRHGQEQYLLMDSTFLLPPKRVTRAWSSFELFWPRTIEGNLKTKVY